MPPSWVFSRSFSAKIWLNPRRLIRLVSAIVVRHLLQRHARLVQLAEQRVDPLQVAILVLQLLVRQRRADAAADDQQASMTATVSAQLQMVVFAGLR